MADSELHSDLVVIGAGMTGLAAALFAANNGVSTIRVGIASEIIFASGFIDLMGVHPISEGKIWENPWDAIDALKRDIPDHPFGRMQKESIRCAMDQFLASLDEAGVSYRRHPDRNTRVILPVGTVKTTYAVPESMWNGAVALAEKPSCLIIGIRGLRGFSARQIAQTLKPAWPAVRHAQISFPGFDRSTEVYTEPMARSLMLSETRRRLADTVGPHVGNARMIGFPAIFGIQGTAEIVSDLENKIGLPIFEIPTMPPSIPGLRIKETLDAELEKKGVRSLLQKRVLNVRPEKRGFSLEIGGTAVEHIVRTKAVILGSGRFIGRGLTADRKRIREALFDLPVHQPGARKAWHRRRFLDNRGHLINVAGLEIDHRFRPLDRHGRPAFDTLFAAGSILAHQDWMRMKCGSGLAIATAYAAVQSYLEQSA